MAMPWLIIPFISAEIAIGSLSWRRRRRAALTPFELGRCLADAKRKAPE